MGETGLAAAAERAVADSAPMVERLRTLTSELAKELAPPERAGEDSSGLLAEERAVRERAVAAVQELAVSRLESMDTFNVVLFGRTNCGKSTLVEALTGGTGSRISTGDIDYTTTVDVAAWQGLRVYDTPGTNGWRADGANQGLEEAARRAVLAADVVLLCFDTLHQLEGEFAKVAEWVLAYGKPAIAVLNVRNRYWRDPAQVPSGDRRSQLSVKVAEHASNIREHLGVHGLARVPLVAISAQRAVAARGAQDYQGPDRDTIALLRDLSGELVRRSGRDLPYRDGRELLLAWSNLPALETLLAAAVTEGAQDLRLGALTGRLTGALTEVAGELARVLTRPAVSYGEQYEEGLEELLTALGRPPAPRPAAAEAAAEAGTGAAAGRNTEFRALATALRELERLRGSRFEATSTGEVRGYLKHRLAARTAPLRTEAENRAEELVESGFRDRREISDEEFSRTVMSVQTVTDAVDAVVAQFETHLLARLSLTAAEARANLKAVAVPTVRVVGDAGSGMRRMGFWSGGVSAAGGILGPVLTAAVVFHFWNPVGWVAAGVAVANSLAYVGGRLLSRFGLGRAARQREAARIESRQEARRAVRGYFADIEAHVLAHGEQRVHDTLLRAAPPLVTEALALRRIAADAARDSERLLRAAAGLPQTREPAGVLREAMGRIEYERDVVDAPDRYWLGSSWCGDPYNLAEPASEEPAGGRSRSTPRFTESLFMRLRSAFSVRSLVPAPGSGRQWLGLLHQELDGTAEAAALLAELDALAADLRPRVVVAGATNSGKSAFVRRLLTESGLPVSDALRSAPGPVTATAAAYEWEGMLLVDTPGFQSGIEPHTAAAVAALADAATVFYLVGPDLVTGDRADLALLLCGNPEEGRAAKADRVVFVINKIDQLAPDPRLGRVFRTMVEGRESALRLYLDRFPSSGPKGPRTCTDAARPGSPGHQIVSMAAAPGELRYDTARDHDAFRDWDGFRDFAAQIRGLRTDLRRNAVDVTVLHGGLARLADLADAERRRAARLEQRIARLGELAEDAAGGARTGRDLVAAAVQDARQSAREFTAGLVDAALAPGLDHPTRKTRGARLDHWSADPEFTTLWAETRAEAVARAGEWLADVRGALRRRLTSKRFVLAFPEGLPATDTAVLDTMTPDATDSDALLRDTAVAAGSLAELNPDDLSAFGEHLGVLIDHDQAVAILDGLAAGSGFLKILNSISRIAKLMSVAEEEQQADAARKALLAAVGASADTWATGVRGGLSPVEAICGRLDALAMRYTDRQNAALDELGGVRERLRVYEAAADGATTRLGIPALPAQRRGSSVPAPTPYPSHRKGL
ncbi:GTPase [Streptomyces sp. AP-93]|uniref:GTPase n=1 Tax=Streptomyces sp. AP-93 TaxID=2929048 RepID=UPI001FAEA48B|nr:GTPase [Streptomyces sp. AP-93]MCJ0872064.1 50S ribosome-binding GTPase [Streptomyces sp. AP-93]